VLSPLLFLLYVNDIANENVKLFADDTNLFISGVDSCVLNQKCNNCLEILHRWFVANRLHMNLEKTNTMVFPSTKAKDISVKLNDKYIENMHYCRYLAAHLLPTY